ncbi:MAG: DCC1-like thiol-disulfide oxidoreductase family protein [Acidobacteriaceae bacterium]|nr:DCC1-like thiol-disulfide oxidoreductase family protein [Acidobacteriaceae bacterium]
MPNRQSSRASSPSIPQLSEAPQAEAEASPESGQYVLLYDGECGLCQRTVGWLLRHDTHERLLFAPLRQSLVDELFARPAQNAAVSPPSDADQTEGRCCQQKLFPVQTERSSNPVPRNSSAVLVLNFGSPTERLLSRSDAILGCLSILGGRWALLAAISRIVPRPLRDRAYNALARNRHRFFPPSPSSVQPTPAQQARFLDL